MDIRRVPIMEVDVWDKNPRGIMREDFERLKRQIERLGVYKPLLVVEEGGRYVTLGGNMRLRALKELGHAEIDVSVVEAPDDARKLEYALSDNDRAGFYEAEKLAELVLGLKTPENDFSLYAADISPVLSIPCIEAMFGPSPKDENAGLGTGGEQHECPKCGYKW